jgi:hypothetical protein
MAEQRQDLAASSPNMPHVVARSNWVAVQWGDRGAWFVIRRGFEGEPPMERFNLPHGDSASSF